MVPRREEEGTKLQQNWQKGKEIKGGGVVVYVTIPENLYEKPTMEKRLP